MMTVLSALMDGRMKEMSKKKTSVPDIFPKVFRKKTYNKTRRVCKNLGCRFEG